MKLCTIKLKCLTACQQVSQKTPYMWVRTKAPTVKAHYCASHCSSMGAGKNEKYSIFTHQIFNKSPQQIPVLSPFKQPHAPHRTHTHTHTWYNTKETPAPDHITWLCQTQLHQLYIFDHRRASWQHGCVCVCCSHRSIAPLGFADSRLIPFLFISYFFFLILIFTSVFSSHTIQMFFVIKEGLSIAAFSVASADRFFLYNWMQFSFQLFWFCGPETRLIFSK